MDKAAMPCMKVTSSTCTMSCTQATSALLLHHILASLLYASRWHVLRGCGYLFRGTSLLPFSSRHSCMMSASESASAAYHECSLIESSCDTPTAGTRSQSRQGPQLPSKNCVAMLCEHCEGILCLTDTRRSDPKVLGASELKNNY